MSSRERSKDRPIRVVMVTGLLPATHYAQYLARAVAKSQEVELVVLADKNDANAEVEGCGVVRPTWTKDWRYLFQIVRAVHRERPDVVHIQHEVNMFGGLLTAVLFPLLMLLMAAMRVRLVTTVHAAVPKPLINARFLALFFGRSRVIRPFMARLFFRCLYRAIGVLSDCLIVHTEYMKNLMIRDYGVAAGRLKMIRHGVPDLRTSDQPKERYFLYFGYIARRKGLESVIDGFARFVRRPEGKGYRLILVGGTIAGQSFAVEEIRKRIDDQGLTGIATLTGFIGSLAELDRLFFGAAAVLVPAEVSIAASGPMAQALSFGKCIIASNIGNLQEEVRHMRDGILVENDQWDRALRFVADPANQGTIAAIENAGLAKAAERNWTGIAEKHLATYKSLLHNTKATCKRESRRRCVVFANWAQGEGGGGDNILGNLMRWWSGKYGLRVKVITSESGVLMYRRMGLEPNAMVEYEVMSSKKGERLLMPLLYVVRTLESIRQAVWNDYSSFDSVYSSSDFWPDSIAGFILKLRYPRIRWISSIYLFAPNPFYGFREGSRKIRFPTFVDLFYFLTQRPMIWLMRHFSDRICVTSEPEVKKLKNPSCGEEHVVVVRGGVDLSPSRDYIENRRYGSQRKKYDVCFMGRFHRQKGVVELMDIWKLVVSRIPDVRLALIGDGPLMDKVRRRIEENHIANNVTLCGALFGEEKYQIFKESKIAVHPAVYDSGGMASAEAMAFGLPVVGFDLEAFKTYYPKGMLKAEKGNLRDFADKIILMLTDEAVFRRYRDESLDLVRDFWDFEKRADELFPQMLG